MELSCGVIPPLRLTGKYSANQSISFLIPIDFPDSRYASMQLLPPYTPFMDRHTVIYIGRTSECLLPNLPRDVWHCIILQYEERNRKIEFEQYRTYLEFLSSLRRMYLVSGITGAGPVPRRFPFPIAFYRAICGVYRSAAKHLLPIPSQKYQTTSRCHVCEATILLGESVSRRSCVYWEMCLQCAKTRIFSFKKHPLSHLMVLQAPQLKFE